MASGGASRPGPGGAGSPAERLRRKRRHFARPTARHSGAG